MPTDPAHASQLVASLTSARRAVLLLLATCAAVIAVSTAGAPPEAALAAPRGYTFAALALAVGAVVARQAATNLAPRLRVRLLLASLLLTGSVGFVGVALALRLGARNTALAYVLGAVILCLRPPARPLAR